MNQSPRLLVIYQFLRSLVVWSCYLICLKCKIGMKYSIIRLIGWICYLTVHFLACGRMLVCTSPQIRKAFHLPNKSDTQPRLLCQRCESPGSKNLELRTRHSWECRSASGKWLFDVEIWMKGFQKILCDLEGKRASLVSNSRSYFALSHAQRVVAMPRVCSLNVVCLM